MTEPCEHKASVGCLLSATTGCCACADRRPWVIAYPIYVDGQGMRLEGKRWHRYCWQCREYWNLQSASGPSNGASSPVDADPTGEPEVAPFSIMSLPADDGDNHDAVTGALIPQANTATSLSGALLPSRPPPVVPSSHRLLPVVLDGRPPAQHGAESSLDNSPPRPRPHPPPMPMLMPLPMPMSIPVILPSPRDNRRRRDASQPGGDDPQSRRRRRLMPNPFGTREEIESDGYVSPLTQMFGRAWGRYRDAQASDRVARTQAEEERRRNDVLSLLGTTPPLDEPIDAEAALAAHEMAGRQRLRERLGMAAVPGHQTSHPLGPPGAGVPGPRLRLASGIQVDIPAHEPWDILDDPPPAPRVAHAHPFVNPIDLQTSRPPAASSEDMTANLACKICFEQKIDTLLEPCMHAAICHWCSDVMREQAHRAGHRPRSPSDATADDTWRCPMCRHEVIESRRIFLP